MEKTRGNGYGLYQKFHFNIRKNFVAVTTTVHWNNLPSDMAESPLLEVFKMQLDRLLDHPI